MDEPVVFPRAPSLFITSRLASIVQTFKSRLQEKVQQKRKSTSPFGVSCQRLRLRAISDLERCAPSSRLTETEEPRSAIEHRDHGRWVNALLGDLDDHTRLWSLSMTRIAADDKLLLSHSQDSLLQNLAQHASHRDAAYVFDSCTFLIGKLETAQSSKARVWAELDAECKRLKDNTYLANLLHLLRQLQYILFQVLVHRIVTRLDEFALHWHKYWQQQKKLGENWFMEWPSGQRPLSTTWPWNIRPSLLVLWGVCWMFYNPPPANQDGARWLMHPDNGYWENGEQGAQAYIAPTEFPDDVYSSISRPAFSPHIQTPAGPIPNTTNPNNLSVHALPHGTTSLRPRHNYGYHGYGISDGQVWDRAAAFPVTSPYVQENLIFQDPRSRDSPWPPSTSGDTLGAYVSSEENLTNMGFVSNPQLPFNFNPPAANVSGVEISPLQQPSNSFSFHPNIQNSHQADSFGPPFQENQAMEGDKYPSPPVDRDRPTSVSTPKAMPEGGTTDPVTTPSSDGGRHLSVRRGDPPLDASKNIICALPECKGLTFKRRCEWNRHMDTHDRPYRCSEAGCDRGQGFTYLGGLLRHTREVHGRNRSNHQVFFCSYPDCIRSSSQPFSRAENLKEHIRRRHNAEGTNASPAAQRMAPARVPQDAPRKRRRASSDKADGESLSSEDEPDFAERVKEQVKRLKRTIREKDARIQQLQTELAAKDLNDLS